MCVGSTRSKGGRRDGRHGDGSVSVLRGEAAARRPSASAPGAARTHEQVYYNGAARQKKKEISSTTRGAGRRKRATQAGAEAGGGGEEAVARDVECCRRRVGVDTRRGWRPKGRRTAARAKKIGRAGIGPRKGWREAERGGERDASPVRGAVGTVVGAWDVVGGVGLKEPMEAICDALTNLMDSWSRSRQPSTAVDTEIPSSRPSPGGQEPFFVSKGRREKKWKFLGMSVWDIPRVMFTRCGQ